MSVIASLPATPNRVKMIWAYVSSLGSKGTSIDELRSLLAPPVSPDW